MSTKHPIVELAFEALSTGEMQHLANKMYKHHGIYPQKLRLAVDALEAAEGSDAPRPKADPASPPFKVGDVVRGLSDNKYAVTTDGWKGRVIQGPRSVYRPTMRVQSLKNPKQTYTVDNSREQFELVAPGGGEEEEIYVSTGAVLTIALGSGTKVDYLLAHSEARNVVLVNMRTGRLWCEPLEVENLHSIPLSVLKGWAMESMSASCDLVLKKRGGV